MVYNYRTKGVCSKEMHIELNDDHTIKSVEVIGGCNGNLQGISRLVEGMKAEDAIARIRGIRCGFKDTSCPDQLSIALTERSRRCSNCIFPCTAYILSLKNESMAAKSSVRSLDKPQRFMYNQQDTFNKRDGRAVRLTEGPHGH